MQTHAATDHQDKQAEHTSIMEIALQNTALVSSLPRIQSNSLLTSATFQTYTLLGSYFYALYYLITLICYLLHYFALLTGV